MGAIILSGGFPISVFSIVLGVSIIIGLVWIVENTSARQSKLYLDAAVGVCTGALIGARIGFVIYRWGYFQMHPIEIIGFHLGGYSLAGGIIGWMIAILVISLIIHDSALELSDQYLPLAGCLMIGIWLGCWFEGTAYGFLSDQWWAIPAADEWGTISNRFPSQFICALSILLLLMLINILREHPPWKCWLERPGLSTAIFVSINSLIGFLMSFIRRDPMSKTLGWRLDAWISLIFFTLGVILLCVIIIRRKSFGRDETVSSQNVR